MNASRTTLPGRAVRSKTTAVLLLVGLCLTLNLHGIDWGLPNGEHDWVADSLAPRGPLLYAKRMLDGEPWFSKYPPVHFMVLAAAYAPYVGYLRLTRGLKTPTESYPYGLADPEFSLMVFTLLARLVSVAMGTGLVLATYATARKLYGSRAGLIAALLVATSYPIVHYSHNANIDVPHLFWTSLALWNLVSIVQGAGRAHYVFLATFTALAVGTKNSIYALSVGMGLVLLAVQVERLRPSSGTPGSRAAATRDLAWGALAFVVALLVAFNLPLNWQGFVDHVQLHLTRSVRGARLVQQAPSWLGGELALVKAYGAFLVEASIWPISLLLLGGVAYGLVRFPRQTALAVVPAITYYFFFLRVHPTAHIRYVLPIYVLLTWPAAKLVDDGLARGRTRALTGAALAGVLAWAALESFSIGMLYRADGRYAVEDWLRQHVAPSTTVVGIGPDFALPRFPTEVHLTRRRVWDYNGQQIGDINDVDAEFAVIGLSVARRVDQAEKVERFFSERGYRLAADFKSPVPWFSREIEDISTINPRVGVFRRVREDADRTATAGHAGGAPERHANTSGASP